jgi:hypothetical protein
MLYNIKPLFIEQLDRKRLDTFPESPSSYIDIISDAVHTSLSIIGRSDALYHDVEHTCLVTLCGLEIFSGKKILEGELSASDWLHYTIALLFHDVGYVKDLLTGDNKNGQIISSSGEQIKVSDASTDAILTPYHVERGKLFIQQRKWHDFIDKEFLCDLISYTQFPVPERSKSGNEAKRKSFEELAVLVGSADLIGQLADPMYNIKIPRLFYELEETNSASKMGYFCPGDLRKGYPGFFINYVRPHISKALQYLGVTEEGRSWISNLNYHVFSQSHKATVERSGVHLLSEISEVTNKKYSELEFIQEILNKVGSYKGWPLGHAYAVELADGEEILCSTQLWYENLSGSNFSEFKRITEDFVFKSGEGLPGRVYESQSVQTIRDVTKDENFPRGKLAEEIGVRGAFAFPMIVAGKVKYVLEFFSPDPEQLDPSVLGLLKYLANQLNQQAELT